MLERNSMERDKDEKKAAESHSSHQNSEDNLAGPRWLPSGLFKALGPVALFLVVVGSVVGAYAYYNITKESVRFPFWLNFMFSTLAFVFVVIQIVIIAQQAEFMKWQTKAMQDSLERTDSIIGQMKAQFAVVQDQSETLRRQLEVTDRPWLKFEAVFTSALTFTPQNVNLGFRFIAKNVGRSVAVNTSIQSKIVVPLLGAQHNFMAEVLEEQRKLCESLEPLQSRWFSYLVFPGDPYIINQGFALGRDEVERGRLANTNFIMMYLVGCVDYQFAGHERHHQTRFAYEIQQRDPGEPAGVLEFDKDVPLERLVFQKMFMGGDYAD